MKIVARKGVSLAALLALMLALGGCGGGYSDNSSGSEDTTQGDGGSSSPNNTSDFVTFTGNANLSVLLDANQDQLSVRTTDRALVMVAEDTRLDETLISSNYIYLRGVRIGQLDSAQDNAGANILVLNCVDGRGMDIVMSSGAWSYTCV